MKDSKIKKALKLVNEASDKAYWRHQRYINIVAHNHFLGNEETVFICKKQIDRFSNIIFEAEKIESAIKTAKVLSDGSSVDDSVLSFILHTICSKEKRVKSN